MLTITWPPKGAILNRHDGLVTPEGLQVDVRGTAPAHARVTVDGHPAEHHGEAFAGRALLRSLRSTVALQAEDGPDASRAELPLWYDRHSVPRYRFSLDDNILFFRDLARGEARSLFEHPYLAFWRRVHRDYGARIHVNIYLACPGFHLSEFPDRFRGEWQDNADWLRLTSHARSDKPDQPYLHAPAEQVVADHQAVTEQIVRFAGEELLSPFTTIHWAEATREACRAVRAQGIRGLIGGFQDDGISTLARWGAARSGDAGALPTPSHPDLGYYLDAAHCAHLRARDYWHDPDEDLFLITSDVCPNLLRAEEVVPFCESVAADPQRGEVIEMIVHEQYFRADLPLFQPDIGERCEAAIRWAAERGLRPVFLREGFLGSPECASS